MSIQEKQKKTVIYRDSLTQMIAMSGIDQNKTSFIRYVKKISDCKSLKTRSNLLFTVSLTKRRK